jgi:hypothetical protein
LIENIAEAGFRAARSAAWMDDDASGWFEQDSKRKRPVARLRAGPGRFLVRARGGAQQPQQTGMPFIMTQQVQPDFIMADMQSQQAWIIAAHDLSPLVQVIVQPSSVHSHWHMPITRLQQQATIPLTCMQHEHIPPASIVHRFCIIPTATLSSLVQTIFMPPGHFSIFTVQRGTIIMFIPVEGVDGMPIVPMPVAPIPMPARSIITALVITLHSLWSSLVVETGHPKTARVGSHYSKKRSSCKRSLDEKTSGSKAHKIDVHDRVTDDSPPARAARGGTPCGGQKIATRRDREPLSPPGRTENASASPP